MYQESGLLWKCPSSCFAGGELLEKRKLVFLEKLPETALARLACAVQQMQCSKYPLLIQLTFPKQPLDARGRDCHQAGLCINLSRAPLYARVEA